MSLADESTDAGHEVIEGDLLWEPPQARRQASQLARYQRWLEQRLGRTFTDYDDLWRWSVEELEPFWASMWDFLEVRASTPYDRVLADRRMPGAQWFPGTTLNFAEHVLDHGRQPLDKTAIIAVAEDGRRQEISWGQLRDEVAAVADALKGLGVEPGDRVVGYMPNIPEAAVAFLACATIGAVWSICSPDFGVRSVVDRFRQIEPTVLFAVDGYWYAGKPHDRTEAVEELRTALPSLQHTVVVPYLDAESRPPGGALLWREMVRWSGSVELQFQQVPFDHPLWILYTSGTTGMPKGIVHGHGGMVIGQPLTLQLHLDLGPDDTFMAFTTTGWVTWNIAVSSLMLGCSIVVYDGSPGHPTTGRLWEVVADTGTTELGMGASYIEICANEGIHPGRDNDLSRLRTVWFSGSPLSPRHYAWVYDRIDPDLWFVSLSGGTDVAGGFVGGNPMAPVRAGETQCRFLGADVHAFDDAGEALIDAVGELVITAPMPTMPLHLWGDEDGSRYQQSYFDTYPGVWRHGDWMKVTPRGSVVIYGRSDSTINRMGVRMGSAEIYRAVESLPEVNDSLVIDLTYQDRASELVLFVVPHGTGLTGELRERIARTMRSELSPRHVADHVIAIDEVPRTLNGKKLEVPIRKILLGTPADEAVKRDSMANPGALQPFVELAATGLPARR